MSLSVPIGSSFESFREQEKPKWLTEKFCDLSHFLFRTRVQLRFGSLSRAPLKLLRLEILPEMAECDCFSRANDPWDVDLPNRIAERHFTLQVLKDAIDLRALLFMALPDVESARFRVYREAANGMRELILTGDTHRNDQTARSLRSLAMRAKILGFRFCMEEGFLQRLSEKQTAP